MSDEDARRPAHGAPAVDTSGAGNAAPQALLDMVRGLRARERGHLASLLHDGPIQEFAAMALELGEVRRMTGAPPGDEPDGLARQMDAVGRSLRSLQDELWPFPRPGSGLIETLKQRTTWLLATPLAVAVGEGAAGLAEADVQIVADVAELILAGLASGEAWNQPVLMVRADPGLIFLELNMTSVLGRDLPSGGSAAAVAWLSRLAAAISARAEIGLNDRRLRIWMEIPRCPVGSPSAGAGGMTGELAGGVAHDFNNLLAVISNYAAPAIDQDIQAEPAPEWQPSDGGSETVLIVEDEPAMREVTRRILSRCGYDVIAAATGHEALEIVASHPGHIDVLLTDVVMPRMLGKETAERIRALRPDVKVLFMSGYTQGVLDSQGLVEAGINLIEKPFTEAHLLAMLRQIVASAKPDPEPGTAHLPAGRKV